MSVAVCVYHHVDAVVGTAVVLFQPPSLEDCRGEIDE